MAKIYFINLQDKKVAIEVSDEIAKQYRDSLREEWRGDAYEGYYSTSLEGITEAGHDFADKQANIEELYVERETQAERECLMRKLKAALPYLTDLQRKTIHKLFVLNMSQSEIAREEGVAHQVINKRVARIYAQLKALIKKV
jgi:DNA-directed RNA polymerase specialized sigma24 family protein